MKKQKKNIISSIVFIIIVAIIIVIIICLTTAIRNNNNNNNNNNKTITTTEEQPTIIEDVKPVEITSIETVTLSYGMDGANAIEIPINAEMSKLIATSNNEEVAKISIIDDKLRIEAVCTDMQETTISLAYNEIEREIKVYVKPTCLVEFYTDGGTSVMPQMVVYGENVVRPENPTKEGYKFVGWYIGEELTEEYDFDLGVESDMTIYAKFQSI